ncbi:MAG: DUF6572 domain-containing protein [Saprospiraceae bacterium]
MSVNQTDTIDVIGTTPNGQVVLTISDHYSWDETWHLQLLQDKINAYLQFIESGQLLDDYPNAAGRELIIETVMKFEPNEEGTSFLEKAKEVVTKAGIGFQWRVLQTDK